MFLIKHKLNLVGFNLETFNFRVEDLAELEEITGSENFLVGKICIARYGKIFRGNKVHNCQTKGAKGKKDNNSTFISFRIFDAMILDLIASYL